MRSNRAATGVGCRGFTFFPSGRNRWWWLLLLLLLAGQKGHARSHNARGEREDRFYALISLALSRAARIAGRIIRRCAPVALQQRATCLPVKVTGNFFFLAVRSLSHWDEQRWKLCTIAECTLCHCSRSLLVNIERVYCEKAREKLH